MGEITLMKLIKSKSRVRKHEEVFTPDWMKINQKAMVL